MSAPDASGLREAARTTSHGDVEEFNRDCPIGTAVLAFPGSRDGRALMTRTRSTAWLVGREPVVMVEGYAGGIALTHIEVVPATPPADDASEGLSEAEREALAETCWLMHGGDHEWGWMNLTDYQRDFHRQQVDVLMPAVERIVAARESAAATRARAEGAVERAKVITLCGSTRFKSEFASWNSRLTLDGNVVISVGVFGHGYHPYHREKYLDPKKPMLDRLHLQKIDMADEVFVIDPGGYVGESTRREIAYAESKGIPVRYLSQEDPTCAECGRDNRNGTHSALERTGHLSHPFIARSDAAPDAGGAS